MTSSAKIDVLFSEAEIHARVQDLARDIVADMGPNILVVGILRGAFVFAADLMRALHHAGAQSRIAFMALSSYGDGTVSRGVRVVHDLDQDVQAENVLIIEDIIESGRTVFFARQLIEERGAAVAKVATLLHKPGFEKVDIQADYTGFVCPPEFVVGYGLDWANRYRDLPYIGCVRQGS